MASPVLVALASAAAVKMLLLVIDTVASPASAVAVWEKALLMLAMAEAKLLAAIAPACDTKVSDALLVSVDAASPADEVAYCPIPVSTVAVATAVEPDASARAAIAKVPVFTTAAVAPAAPLMLW